MALISEAGASNAESYCSVAFADQYHLARGRELAWVDKDKEIKEQALRIATDFMLHQYRTRWIGVRATTTQALDWPRLGAVKPDSPAYYSNTDIPVEVQKACAELAFKALSGPLVRDEGPRKVSAQVGPISVTYADSAKQNLRYTSVEEMLAPLLLVSSASRIPIERS